MDKALFEAFEERLWDFLTDCLEKYADHNRHGYWTNGQDILCRTEEEAEHLANFLEDIGFDCVMTGCYEPEEDERSGETDACTGFYYVALD